MTADYTPADAGTDLSTLATRVADRAGEWYGMDLADDLNLLILAARKHRCSLSVTDDHTPAEAGPERPWVSLLPVFPEAARQLADDLRSTRGQPGEHPERYVAITAAAGTLAAAVGVEDPRPSVVPGDTATEGERRITPEMVAELNRAAGKEHSADGQVMATLRRLIAMYEASPPVADGLLATVGTEEAGRARLHRQSLARVIATAMDPGTQPPQEAPYTGLKLADHIARAVLAAEAADASPQGEAQGQGEDSVAVGGIDPVYRNTARAELEAELRQCRSDHRDLYADLQRRTAERDAARGVAPVGDVDREALVRFGVTCLDCGQPVDVMSVPHVHPGTGERCDGCIDSHARWREAADHVCVVCGTVHDTLDGLWDCEDSHNATLADGAVLRDRTAGSLGIAGGPDGAMRWAPDEDEQR